MDGEMGEVRRGRAGARVRRVRRVRAILRTHTGAFDRYSWPCSADHSFIFPREGLTDMYLGSWTVTDHPLEARRCQPVRARLVCKPSDYDTANIAGVWAIVIDK